MWVDLVETDSLWQPLYMAALRHEGMDWPQNKGTMLQARTATPFYPCPSFTHMIPPRLSFSFPTFCFCCSLSALVVHSYVYLLFMAHEAHVLNMKKQNKKKNSMYQQICTIMTSVAQTMCHAGGRLQKHALHLSSLLCVPLAFFFVVTQYNAMKC